MSQDRRYRNSSSYHRSNRIRHERDHYRDDDRDRYRERDRDRDRHRNIDETERRRSYRDDKYSSSSSSRREHDYNERRYKDRSRDHSRDRHRNRRRRSRTRSKSSESSNERKLSRKTQSIDRNSEHSKYSRESKSTSPKKFETIKQEIIDANQMNFYPLPHHPYHYHNRRNATEDDDDEEEDDDDDDETGENESMDSGEAINKEKIHKEMQERLRQHLAAEGKVYPPPKPKASHPIFANDGSFLETFKRMQEQQQQNNINEQKQYERKLNYNYPVFGKRRGGKILKTGIVEKPRPIEDASLDTAKDAWSIYMQEVKKYKTTACDVASKTRPLLK